MKPKRIKSPLEQPRTTLLDPGHRIAPNPQRTVQHATGALTFITKWANMQIEQVISSYQKKVKSSDWPSHQPFQSHHDLALCHACR